MDLDGEGFVGVLTGDAEGWFYKRNLSAANTVRTSGGGRVEARFSAAELLASKPALGAGSTSAQFFDLAGDGQLELVTLSGPSPGFYERSPDEGWEQFTAFKHLPVLEWDDPNLRFIDLTGNGTADILITEDEVLCWHLSLSEAGFGQREATPQARDEEKGPRLIFAESTQTIYLADMSGDGLTDLVRIRNGEVCYWPNLGYGCFGTKVAMGHSPCFDSPDLFDPQRIRLADLDGSGVTDILYLGGDGARIYFNQSGNSWSPARAIPAFPRVDDHTSVAAVDLLGGGTACLVWSSPLPGDASRPMRYLDLAGGKKPHLLVSIVNNLGAETHVQYAPSTKFFLQDKLAGKPWISALPFPVHVVERVEIIDRISRNRFVTRNVYHHGYFDGEEREFRGFGMIEQWDTEEFGVLNANQEPSPATNVAEASHVPPALTRTWFHTGIPLGRDRVSNFFAGLIDGQDIGEYYREPGLTDDQAKKLLLDDTILPPGLTADEEREACRALKGTMLRQEVYALDGTDKEAHPYSVTEQSITIRLLQPRADNRHAVFFAHSRESIDYHYERIPNDPRVAHSLTLDVDDFGNVLKSAAVAYGRRQTDPALETRDQDKQSQLHVLYEENRFTDAVRTTDSYRTPLSCEVRRYELTGLSVAQENDRFTLGELLSAGTTSESIAYQETPVAGAQQRRLVEHARILYRENDLEGALPLGQLQSRAIPFETYQLSLTKGLVERVYGTRVSDPVLINDGHYVHSEGDDQWWVPSGRVFFSSDTNDDASEELAYARLHFFRPHRYQDPFENTSSVSFDAYDLLIKETRDALANIVTVGERSASGDLIASGNDYRVLQPRLVTNPNGNRAAVAFDVLGLVVGTAVMGKRDESPRKGDLLDGFIADLPDDAVANHLADPLADPHGVLQRATTRLMYDLFAYSRTKHQPQPAPNILHDCA